WEPMPGQLRLHGLRTGPASMGYPMTPPVDSFVARIGPFGEEGISDLPFPLCGGRERVTYPLLVLVFLFDHRNNSRERYSNSMSLNSLDAASPSWSVTPAVRGRRHCRQAPPTVEDMTAPKPSKLKQTNALSDGA